MKIYVIDAYNREVREAEVPKIYPHAKELVGILTMEAAMHWPNGDTLYVDEEGLLPPLKPAWFKIAERGQPMAGNGFVCGREIEGDEYPDGWTNADPAISLDKLRSKITWLTLGEAVQALLALPEPQMSVRSFSMQDGEKIIFSRSWEEFLRENGYPLAEPPSAPRIFAPWTPEQVDLLNSYQRDHHYHPYTCGKRGETPHANDGALVATRDGWICPYCDYTQNWAFDPQPRS